MKKLWTLLVALLLVYLLGTAAKADVQLPPGLTEIDDYAFADDKKLSGHLEIPYGVTRIGDYAFSGCSNITSVTIPDSVTEIGMHAFLLCEKLKSVTIPNSVTVIGLGAFSNCTALTSVTISDSVKVIGDSAFMRCLSLKSVTIPKSVEQVERYAFYGCQELKKVSFSEETVFGSYSLYDTQWMWDQAQAVVNSVTHNDQTDFEKMLALHDWMTETNQYDLSITYFSPDMLFLTHTGVCQAYQEAYSCLLKLAGIESMEVIGSGNGSSHGWNLVKLDGDWYHVDCTWDDPLIMGQYDGPGRHDYCCVPDSVMQEDHVWDASAYPAATGTKYFRGEKVK